MNSFKPSVERLEERDTPCVSPCLPQPCFNYQQNYHCEQRQQCQDLNSQQQCSQCQDLNGWQNSATPQNVEYVVNGQIQSNLDGAAPGSQVGVIFTVNGTGTYSLASYTAPNGTLNTYNLNNQHLYSGISLNVTQPGTYYMEVTIPPCGYFQVDFYRGCIAQTWDTTALNNWSAGAGVDGYFGGNAPSSQQCSENCYNAPTNYYGGNTPYNNWDGLCEYFLNQGQHHPDFCF